MLIAFLAVDLIGIAVLVYGLATSVEGYQDEHGFHEGREPAMLAAPAAVPASVVATPAFAKMPRAARGPAHRRMPAARAPEHAFSS